MVLFLNVNNVCDLCCSYCFYTIGHEKRDSSYIHSCQAETFASTIQELGFGCVILSGGDPLCSKLKEHTYSLIEHLKKRGLRVIINTSGAKLGDDDYERLIALEVDRIDVSINSCDEVIHNLERGYYQDAVRLIDTLQKKGYTKLSTTTVITQS
ncbi:MAG: radical SAM protein, partial [Candidatus Saccharibacteria bacterium]|nr:radical SAM protein [Candidatus Saccharibacteria bacterium]